MDYFTKCNPPPTSCILCLLLTAFLSRYHVLHQQNRRQRNGELLFSSTLIFRFIVSLRPWPLQTSPIRCSLEGENTKRSFFSFLLSPFHVKTAQLPTIDKCKEQHQAGSEGEGGSLGIRLSCRYCCIPILSE